MIDLQNILKLFPNIPNEGKFLKYLIKEYLELMVLDFLSVSPYVKHLTFIGGTNLRLIKGINRFSEDLDFDIKEMSKEKFMEMTSAVVRFLQRNGLNVELREKENPKLTAFRSNLYFPGLLYELGITKHKDERFLLKIEAQDQGIKYNPDIAYIMGGGFFFPFPVPPDDTLLSMKLTAMLRRAKGRDFYDIMFLLNFASPDYNFLNAKTGINDDEKLISQVEELLKTVKLEEKKMDFHHLLFNEKESQKIMMFKEFLKLKLGGNSQ